MVCNWSVFDQKVSIFGLALTKFKLSKIQIDFSVQTLRCAYVRKLGTLG